MKNVRLSAEYDVDQDGESVQVVQNEIRATINGRDYVFAQAVDGDLAGHRWAELAEEIVARWGEVETLRARAKNSVDADTVLADLTAKIIPYPERGRQSGYNEGVQAAMDTIERNRARAREVTK